jgi:hypothetical protein
MLALMALNLCRTIVDWPHDLPFDGQGRLGQQEEAIIDLWEASGLSWLARPAFLLSHVYDNGVWSSITPQMEGFYR